MKSEPEEQDEPLPPDQWLKCGRCREPFFCAVHRGRLTFIPLFCEACDGTLAAELQAREARRRERKAATAAVKLDAKLADALLKPPKKKGFTKRAKGALV